MNQLGDPRNGVHFNLFNNIWSTKYVFSCFVLNAVIVCACECDSYPLWYPFDNTDLNQSFDFAIELLA